ncbi:MAG TPA: Hpt domain-containing protein [Opitutaceae bacterium]
MSSEPVIDPVAIETLRSLNPEDDSFLREVVGIFIEDTPQRLAELRTAFADADSMRFTRAAHSIKGSASNLGAGRLRALAEQIELGSRKNGLSGLDGLIPALENEFGAAKIALEKIVG